MKSWRTFFGKGDPMHPGERPSPPEPPSTTSKRGRSKTHGLVSNVFPTRVKLLREDRTYLIGRSPTCDIVLPGETVSRRHAEIVSIHGGAFQLRDLGSRNGTWVNDRQINEHTLRDTDEVRVSVFLLRYRSVYGDLSAFLDQPVEEDRTKRVSSFTDGPDPTRGISGEFDDTDLLEICQLVELNEKCGIMQIRSGALSGRIDFLNGKIVSAAVGNMSGEMAARRLLRIPRGEFQFMRERVTEEPGLNMSPTAVVVDICRARDERAHSGDTPPTEFDQRGTVGLKFKDVPDFDDPDTGPQSS